MSSHQGKILKYSLLLAVLPRNILDPSDLYRFFEISWFCFNFILGEGVLLKTNKNFLYYGLLERDGGRARVRAYTSARRIQHKTDCIQEDEKKGLMSFHTCTNTKTK